MYHSHKLRNIIIAVVVVVLIVAIIVGVVVVMNMRGTPILEVSNVSLNPSEINVNGSSTFTFTIKNNDAEKPHSVNVVFNTISPVTFYQNNVSLPVGINMHINNSGFQYLSITLQSSQQSTYPLKVSGTLTEGASTSTYSIRIQFYNENSTNFDTETESLKVDAS